jgi:hypothetical protein
MRIIEEPIVEYQIDSGILSAQYISDYKIKITFDNGLENVVDFELFLSNSQHPSIRKYLDLKKFKQFQIVNGNINWNDYDMIFPLTDLRKGKIS